jgi:hypothetical protein
MITSFCDVAVDNSPGGNIVILSVTEGGEGVGDGGGGGVLGSLAGVTVHGTGEGLLAGGGVALATEDEAGGRRCLPFEEEEDCWPCWPQGQPIGGEEARVFLHAWREKAQSLVYLAPRREPSIVAALKKEYQDFYKSIGLSRSAVTTVPNKLKMLLALLTSARRASKW